MIVTTAALTPLLLARHLEAATLAAVGTYLLLFKGAKVARGHEQMAFLVSMLKQILYDMSSFLVIIVLMVLATAFAFSLLTPQEEYRGFARSLFTSYTFLMFGGGVDSVELYFDAHPALRCLYLATTISVQIVMLNALIAIMGDTYSRVSETRVAQGLQQRAELLVELAATMSARQRADGALFPRWIHVVQRKEAGDVEDDWAGQIGAIKKTIGAVQTKVGTAEAKMEAKMGAIEAKIGAAEAKLEAKMEAKMGVAEAKMGAVEAKMDLVEAKIDQMLALLAK